MKSRLSIGMVLVGVLALGDAAARPSLLAQSTGSAALSAPRNPTRAEVVQMMKDISNWGRWGKDDEIGTFNLITPAVRKAAVALVREGISVSMAHTLDKEVLADNPTPFKQEFLMGPDGKMRPGAAMDVISSTYHATTTTHMDSLCHYIFEGKTYNGWEIEKYHQATPTREGFGEGPGCMKNSILGFKDGLLTRGILIDLPLMKGVKWLEPGTPVTIADLEAWEVRRHPDRQRRRVVPPHRPIRAPVRARPVALGPRVRGIPRLGDALVQAARRRAHQQRLGAGRAAVEHRGVPAAHPHAVDQLARDADDRRGRPRGGGPGGGPAEALDVHADRDGIARTRRVGLASEPDSNVLKGERNHEETKEVEGPSWPRCCLERWTLEL
jgi:hypothetical protein